MGCGAQAEAASQRYEDVLSFVFPHSSFGRELTAENIELKIKERAFTRFNELKGIS